MHRHCLILFTVSSLFLLGCSRNKEAELARAKAEAEAAKAKAEVELARVELEKLKAAQAKPEAGSAPKVEPAPADPKNDQATSGAGQPSSGQPGPLVFDRTMTGPAILNFFNVAYSQYGGRPKPDPGNGVKLGFGHTAPAIWVKPFLGSKYRAEFEMKFDNEHGWATCVLNGPGHGNSGEAGYGCFMNQQKVMLSRDGKEVGSIAGPKAKSDWVRVQANVDGGKIEVRLDNVPYAEFEDPQPLNGPANGWFGLVGSNVTLRHLRVWSPETNGNRERQLTPPVTEKPAANGELLYQLDLAGTALGAEWRKSQPQNAQVKDKALVLQGPNGAPDVMLDKALKGSVACEAEFEYHDDEAVNFSLALLFADKPPSSLEEINKCAAWRVALPQGNGKSEISWHKQSDGGKGIWSQGQSLASTAYYAPIAGRKYLARVETHGDELRVFIDGGLLLKAKRTEAAPSKPAFFSMRQIYGGSKVYAARIYQLAK